MRERADWERFPSRLSRPLVHRCIPTMPCLVAAWDTRRHVHARGILVSSGVGVICHDRENLDVALADPFGSPRYGRRA